MPKNFSVTYLSAKYENIQPPHTFRGDYLRPKMQPSHTWAANPTTITTESSHTSEGGKHVNEDGILSHLLGQMC